MLCCSKVRKKSDIPYSRGETICKKGFFSMMLARVDELDTLTPLINNTPTQTSVDSVKTNIKRPICSQVGRFTTSDSPPPPRRLHHGKTLIVPLNASRYRTPITPVLGTPDSRITSFEAGTTKSCATIPEDDEDAESTSCERIDDLISIDRTTVSLSEQKSNRGYYSHSSYNLILPVAPPEFQIPVPLYSPPSVPDYQYYTQQLSTDNRCHLASPEDQLSLTNSIGSYMRDYLIIDRFLSPNSIDSPADITGSFSDSFYINSDVISSTNGSQVADENAGIESDVQNKYQLHRIEEESEEIEDGMRCTRTIYSENNLDCERNIIMARSISEQV
ncbi:hypothetical protein DICVIV_10685 [Dictyocaulus viviparus]|uniref:Uncharacterized protein n=1 Tax=Dictyocaulus viviparus TaxID=29172 RepID=A0A0D8XF90_DICVI|nr:hypothetical protein DICVIV_10685 [Dictyocaulus viviparus]